MSDQVRIRYIGPFDEVEVEAHDDSTHFVKSGESKEFPADVAKSLLEQPDNWEPAAKSQAKAKPKAAEKE